MNKKTKKHKTAAKPMGKPRLFNSPEEMQVKIDEFFKTEKELTITGLCLFLGMKSRQALINYEGYSKEYHDIIKVAKMRVEMYYEKKLTQNNCTGSIFWLKNAGWKDKQDIEHSGDMGINIISWKKDKD